ncbi:MAG: hypothetical protein OEW21_08960 [Betaproteobacteria bacterium]|nr:hypothetical protein [Betaproteobacteria bacterium]
MDDPATAPYGISMDGSGITGGEVMALSVNPPTNPGSGVVAFTGQTQIINAQTNGATTLLTRIVVTVTQSDGVTPIPLQGVDTFGITPRMGIGGFEIPNAGGIGAYRVNMKGEVSQNGGTTWIPYLNYFDSFTTIPGTVAGYSFGASFYDK